MSLLQTVWVWMLCGDSLTQGTFEKFMKTLSSAKLPNGQAAYKIRVYKLNTQAFLPQRRRRLYFVGIKQIKKTPLNPPDLEKLMPKGRKSTLKNFLKKGQLSTPATWNDSGSILFGDVSTGQSGWAVQGWLSTWAQLGFLLLNFPLGVPLKMTVMTMILLNGIVCNRWFGVMELLLVTFTMWPSQQECLE